ncbi:MAG: DEAD/DEAH box helicase [Firmicutes bacterium]|nr:DEAD/DEAH box helicase [Bacillota bacterium]
MPGYLYSYHRFRETFERNIVKYADMAATGRLNAMTAPFILRRLKRDVLSELPEKQESVIEIELEDKQKDVYAAHALMFKESIKSLADDARGKIQILAFLTRLRQLCCDPSLFLENYAGNSAKLEAALDLVSSAVQNGHKVLLFSQFTSMLAIIGKRLSEEGIEFFLLQGDTKVEDRVGLVDAFNAGSTQVFLISLKAGGTGLNLTGADIVIHYDPWWNLSVQNQATDRAHRIGQKNVVSVYKLILKNTIEEKIVTLQNRKKELFDSIIREGETDITKMTKDEILSLLE